jgi:hypothetical protein
MTPYEIEKHLNAAAVSIKFARLDRNRAQQRTPRYFRPPFEFEDLPGHGQGEFKEPVSFGELHVVDDVDRHKRNDGLVGGVAIHAGRGF